MPSETRIKTVATSTGICNSVLEKITYIYNPFIDITNFPISVNACFDDTVNFNPTFSILNYSSSYTYENNGTFIPLDNQIFDYTVNGSNLTIWNIQSPTTIKIVASSNGPCSYSSSKTSILKSDLYGVIYTSSFVGLPNTTIYAIDLNPIDSSITAIDTVLSGNNGAFILSAFDVDYLKIAPSLATYPNEMPSYYFTTLFIQDATTVSCQTNPHIFRTVAGVNPGGTGFIAGYIGQGAGKANEIGQPISEQFIVIKDSNDDPVQYAITDNNGYFSFSNLAYGEYSFHVDKPFVNNMLAPSVTLTAAESRKDSLLFILHPDHLELLAKPTAINDLIFSNEFVVSPNPANAFLNIEITNPTYLGLSKEIKIMDALGKELYFTTSAKNQIKIDLSNENISEGIYLISITLENQTITKKILIN